MKNTKETPDIVDLESYMTDGIYTFPSSENHYTWRKMIGKVQELGRPLTAEESKEYKLSDK